MLNEEKLRSLLPLSELEEGAINQIENALSLPFLKKLAIMPDCHTGYDLPIGGVALLDNVISASYVGYDIGCGMRFVNTSIPINLVNKDDLIHIDEEVRKVVPVGTGREFEFIVNRINYGYFESASGDHDLNNKVNSKLNNQLGTLGGGNHFIEFGVSREYNTLCFTIHSGSRNPGHSVAGYYMGKEEPDGSLPKGFFRLDSELGKAYRKDAHYMLKYAFENRSRMQSAIYWAMVKVLGECIAKNSVFTGYCNEVSIHHNFFTILGEESHEVLHRKGAISAGKGVLGIIPGSMRDGVYITEGLGNEEYLSSSSHGAGRRMSRSKAKKNIDFSVFKEQMKDVVVSNLSEKLIDEAPDAYKKLQNVIDMQEGKVIKVVDFISPILNIKG